MSQRIGSASAVARANSQALNAAANATSAAVAAAVAQVCGGTSVTAAAAAAAKATATATAKAFASALAQVTVQGEADRPLLVLRSILVKSSPSGPSHALAQVPNHYKDPLSSHPSIGQQVPARPVPMLQHRRVPSQPPSPRLWPRPLLLPPTSALRRWQQPRPVHLRPRSPPRP